MSMHILPVYYTTTNHKKRKKKTLNSAKYENACRQHNKFLKRHGLGSPLSLQQYIDNIHGRVRIDSKQYGELNLRSYDEVPRRSSTRDIPSVSLSLNPKSMEGRRVERPVYTGEAVIGQAYNKGGMQVLTPLEVKDPTTGKRR
jgi:hypothetical protein